MRTPVRRTILRNNGDQKAVEDMKSAKSKLSKILNSAKLSFKNEGEIVLPDKQKLRDQDARTPALQKIIKEVFQREPEMV